jgi:hypothetical protein
MTRSVKTRSKPRIKPKGEPVLAIDSAPAPDEGTPRRNGLFVLVGIAIAFTLMVGLYQAKTEAQATRKRIVTLESELRETKRAISARQAEIAYLERPERLKTLARDNLRLKPVAAEQMKSLDDLEESAEPIYPAP